MMRDAFLQGLVFTCAAIAETVIWGSIIVIIKWKTLPVNWEPFFYSSVDFSTVLHYEDGLFICIFTVFVMFKLNRNTCMGDKSKK